MRARLRTRRWLTIALLPVLALAGCSSGTSPSAEVPATVAPASDAPIDDTSADSAAAASTSPRSTGGGREAALGDVLPADWRTVWNPGVSYGGGGMPSRDTVCATLSPSGGDDTPLIQRAIDDCPGGEVVQLEAGSFEIRGEGLYIRKSGVTLRGAGPGDPASGEGGTRLVKTDPEAGFAVLYLSGGGIHLADENYPEPSIDFGADGVKGSTSVTLESTDGLAVGEYVYIDHDTLDDPNVVWTESQRDDDSGGERRYFNRTDRSLAQVMKITAIDGDEVNFETPFHTTFPTAFDAELTRFADNDGRNAFIEWVGVEDLYFEGGSGGDWHGNVALDRCGYCWVSNIESNLSHGTAVGLYSTYRSEIRDSYIHSTADPYPGGGGYLLGMHFGAADNLIENNIVVQGNKVITMRASGGGNVIAYNYMDDAYIENSKETVEVGLNAGHYTTPHMELFEGNESFNFDGDFGFGNSFAITIFRNHITGIRRDAGDLGLTDVAPRRVIGLQRYHYHYNFVANVLGYEDMTLLPGQEEFVYELTDEHHLLPDGPRPQVVPMWALGYNGDDMDAAIDPNVAETTIRHGNYDFVTNQIVWDDALPQELPPSLYLTSKPAFFGDLDWPWVTPEHDGAVGDLPAQARYDAIVGT